MLNNNMSITPEAAEYFAESVKKAKCAGFRIDIVPGGCSGYRYEITFVNDKSNSEDLFMEMDGFFLSFSPKMAKIADGMIIDYVQTPMQSQIVLKNPNVKSKCGCGQSFCGDDMGPSEKGSCSTTCN